MTVAVAHVSPPAATAEGLSWPLALVTIRLMDKRTSDTALDWTVMVPHPWNSRPYRRQMGRYNGLICRSRIAGYSEKGAAASAELDCAGSGRRRESEVSDDVDDEVGGAGELSAGGCDRAVVPDLNDCVVGPRLSRAVVDRRSGGQRHSQGIDRDVAQSRGLRDGDVDGDGVGLSGDAAASHHEEGAGRSRLQGRSSERSRGVSRIGQPAGDERVEAGHHRPGRGGPGPRRGYCRRTARAGGRIRRSGRA